VELYRVLERPLITEKATTMAAPHRASTTNLNVHRYAFEVPLKATKPEIKQAVEARFGRQVIAVNTMIYKPKEKGQGTRRGLTSPWKKAVVTLAHGQSIDDFFGTV